MIALLERELKRFLRQKGRISGALVTPVVIWVILGQGIGASFSSKMPMPENGGYLSYFFPGVLLMVLLFTAIFSMITVIEDRDSGFLQGLWVSPLSNRAMVMSKILGCSLIALAQGAVFLLFAPFAGFSLGFLKLLMLLGILSLSALQLSALSFVVAWKCESTQAFHVWMNLLLLPLWLFSGAAFDLAQVPAWMAWLSFFNPLTYALSAVRELIYASELSYVYWDVTLEGLITLVFALIFFSLAVFLLRRQRA